MRVGVTLLFAVAALAGCAQPKTCDSTETTFVVEPGSEVRVSATVGRKRQDRVEVQLLGSVTLPDGASDSVAVVMSGPGYYYVAARRAADPIELLFQRFDSTDAVVTAEVIGIASAAHACSLSLELLYE